MTESEWCLCQEPQAMLAFLREGGWLSDRKARLFAVACCRRIWHLMVDERSREAVEVAERFADGGASKDELMAARARGLRAHEYARAAVRSGDSSPCLSASWTAYRVARSRAADGARDSIDFCSFAISGVPRQSANQAHFEELGKQAALLRDLFGPLPFRPVALDASWLAWGSGTVGRLARAAYEGRRMPAGVLEQERLAVLADGLEEAGCGDSDVLGHLRDRQQGHVRGCFVLDLLLGKE
jgi:hypothetical protein